MLDHLHLVVVVLPVVLVMVRVYKLAWELVLVEDEAVGLLRPGHDGVSEHEWIKLQNPCREELGFELGGEVVQLAHIVPIVRAFVKLVDFHHKCLLRWLHPRISLDLLSHVLEDAVFEAGQTLLVA